MNIASFFAAAAAIGVSVMAISGIDAASGGKFYLASIARLAQETSPVSDAVVVPSPQPPPPPPSSDVPPPPLPSDVAQPFSSPPERPVAPMDPIQPPPQQPPQPQPPQQPRYPTREGEFFGNGHEGGPSTPEDDGERQEFIDPREIQQVLRDIKQMRNDIKRNYLKQIKKLGDQNDLNQLNEILSDLDKFQNAIGNGSGDVSAIREAVDDFREGQYWERLNKIRARLEIPKEIKQIILSLRRMERTAKTKAVQNIGLNLDRVRQVIGEMNQNVATVQSHYNSGNLEEAQEAMQEFHENAHPGEIESTIMRVKDIKNMLKRVKDGAIRAEVERVLQEVIDAFNNGEYRDAREALDEYDDDLRSLINKYLTSTGFLRRNKPNREESLSKIRNLEGLIRAKLQEGGNGVQNENRRMNQGVPGQAPQIRAVERAPAQPVAPMPASPAPANR